MCYGHHWPLEQRIKDFGQYHWVSINCSDKSGIGFGDNKEQKQSASTSHDTRTQGKVEQKIQHKDGLLKLHRVGKVKEKKVHLVLPVFICLHCGMHDHIRPYCYKLHGRVSHKDGRNSNNS